VLSDVVGETGQKILRAIVAGERDGQVLAAMKNVRVRASADEMALCRFVWNLTSQVVRCDACRQGQGGAQG
jgi:hypothetical protein